MTTISTPIASVLNYANLASESLGMATAAIQGTDLRPMHEPFPSPTRVERATKHGLTAVGHIESALESGTRFSFSPEVTNAFSQAREAAIKGVDMLSITPHTGSDYTPVVTLFNGAKNWLDIARNLLGLTDPETVKPSPTPAKEVDWELYS